MLVKDLMEDVDSDIFRSGMVDKLRLAIYSYLYDFGKTHGNDHRLPTSAEYKGVEHPALPIRSIERYKHGLFADIMVVFNQIEKGAWGGEGFSMPLNQPTAGINYVVFVDTRGETVLDCLRAIGGQDMAHVFRHEFQHILDMKRRKDQKFKPGRPHEGPTGYTAYDVDPVAYHNHPLERNAYWHNLAEPLLTNLRNVSSDETEFLDSWELILPDNIPDDFSEFLKSALLRAPAGTRKHMSLISPENRKRGISRLYQLHQRYIALRNKAVNGIAKRWQEEDTAK